MYGNCFWLPEGVGSVKVRGGLDEIKKAIWLMYLYPTYTLWETPHAILLKIYKPLLLLKSRKMIFLHLKRFVINAICRSLANKITGHRFHLTPIRKLSQPDL